jgi:opacity protein-like surface antigen
MNKIRSLFLTTVAGLLVASPAMAVGGGFYLGGSVGGATTDVNNGEFKFDDSDAAYKIFGGFHFLQFFAVEGGYRDIGTVKNDALTLKPTGWDIAGMAGLPLGPVYLFGKVGVINWDADTNEISNDSDTGYEVGIGASINLLKIQLRAEAEYLDVLDGSIMYTVGAAWRF